MYHGAVLQPRSSLHCVDLATDVQAPTQPGRAAAHRQDSASWLRPLGALQNKHMPPERLHTASQDLSPSVPLHPRQLQAASQGVPWPQTGVSLRLGVTGLWASQLSSCRKHSLLCFVHGNGLSSIANDEHPHHQLLHPSCSSFSWLQVTVLAGCLCHHVPRCRVGRAACRQPLAGCAGTAQAWCWCLPAQPLLLGNNAWSGDLLPFHGKNGWSEMNHAHTAELGRADCLFFSQIPISTAQCCQPQQSRGAWRCCPLMPAAAQCQPCPLAQDVTVASVLPSQWDTVSLSSVVSEGISEDIWVLC